MTKAAQLSCEQCKQRKTKCDKHTPCSACRASNIACRPVQRARLPRGRTKAPANKKSLEDKLARLEKLVDELESQTRQPDVDGGEDGVIEPSHVSASHRSNRLETSSAQDFWLALSNEVAGLREILEGSDTDYEEHLPRPVSASLGSSLSDSSSCPSLFPMTQQNGYIPLPSEELRQLLLYLYRTRVDWLFKVLHWPSILNMLNRDRAHHAPTPQADHALEYAIYFLASCTLLESEFEQRRLGERSAMIEQYRHATKMLLSQANLLTTTDTTVLQAFVLYIAAVRCSVSAASAWTLVAVAVRIAQACNLNSDSTDVHSAFELESRRRLWFSVAYLDALTSLGRGTVPLLSHQDLKAPPKVIDDGDMSSEVVMPQPTNSFTDMTFSNLCHQAMICQKKLLDPSFGSWRERLEVVNVFEHSVMQMVERLGTPKGLEQSYTRATAMAIPTTMQLLLWRPLYRNFSNAVPPVNDNNVLEVGCRVLQAGLAKTGQEDFAILSWFRWPKWFALVVVLVELCSLGGSPAFDGAFAVAQDSFDSYAQSAADMHSGELWKPISKLMRRVRRLRQTRLPAKTGTEHDGGVPIPKRPELHSESCNRLDPVELHDMDYSILQQSASLAGDLDFIVPNSVPTECYGTTSYLQWDIFLSDFDAHSLFDDF